MPCCRPAEMVSRVPRVIFTVLMDRESGTETVMVLTVSVWVWVLEIIFFRFRFWAWALGMFDTRGVLSEEFFD